MAEVIREEPGHYAASETYSMQSFLILQICIAASPYRSSPRFSSFADENVALFYGISFEFMFLKCH